MIMTSPNPVSPPAVAVALKKAGLRTPSQMLQIWTWVKDHPRVLATDIGSTLPIPMSSVSSVLAQLVARKMMQGKKEWSVHAKRELTYYTAIGKTYELLPDVRPKPLKPSAPASLAVAEPAQEPTPTRSTIEEMTDRLTVGEARALYRVLDRMFGTWADARPSATR